MAEYSFKAYEHTTSTLINSTDTLEKTVIVSPAYVMETPSHAFARENSYSKQELIYSFSFTTTASEINITAFAGYIKGDVGIHFIELQAPMKIDISSECDGTYNICFGVTYTKNQATIVRVSVLATPTTCTNGTLIGVLTKGGGGSSMVANSLSLPNGGEHLQLYSGTTAELPILCTGVSGSNEHLHVATY